LAKYTEARTALEKIQKSNPEWNQTVVSFRLNYLAGKIAALSKGAPGTKPAAGATPQAEAPAPAVTPGASPETVQMLNALKEQVRQLQDDKGNLEAKLKEALAAQPAAVDPRQLAQAQENLKALQKENELLKASLETEKARTAAPADAKTLEQAQQSLAEANRNLAAQKEVVAKLELEKSALEAKLKPTPGTTVGSLVMSGPSSDSDQVRQLERERDDLAKKLAAANNQLYGRRSKSIATQMEEQENTIANLRARVEIFEARQVPYSAEELALMKTPEIKPADPVAKSSPRSIRELSPAAARLVVEARQSYDAGQYARAESAYLEVLREDPNNVPTLANLAAVEIQSERFDAADRNIRRALSLDPENAYCLSVIGRLRLLQKQYDEALDYLGHAEKLDPKSAEVQNFIGLTLSQKGLRGPAETAFRKAIQLDPTYAGAHNNLAVVYLHQQPPATELARWHYQKALTMGYPRNPELEKQLGEPPPQAKK
jgi:tetratricopeptide (TPR) repeat protein